MFFVCHITVVDVIIIVGIMPCCILKTVFHRRCNNNIIDVAQEVMQHILPQETKLTMSAAPVFFKEQYQQQRLVHTDLF